MTLLIFVREGKTIPYTPRCVSRYEIKAHSENIILFIADLVFELQGSLREGALLRVKRVAVEEPA